MPTNRQKPPPNSDCPRCHQPPGKRCLDLRYVTYLNSSHQLYIDRPHRERPR